MAQGRVQAVPQQIFVTRSQHGNVGNVPQKCNIKGSVVGCTVLAYKARTVYAKSDRQILQAHIVHNLIVRALQKCGIHRQRGPLALTGKACRKGYGVLLADAHIHKTVGKARAKLVRARALWHGRRNGNYLVVALGKLGQGIAEH